MRRLAPAINSLQVYPFVSSRFDLLEHQIDNLREVVAGFRVLRYTIEKHGSAPESTGWLASTQRSIDVLEAQLRDLEEQWARRQGTRDQVDGFSAGFCACS